MFDREVTMELAVRDTPEMITSAAILSGFARLFAEKLLAPRRQDPATGGSIEVRIPDKPPPAAAGGGFFFRYTPILCVRQASPCVPYKKSNSCRKIRRSVIESKQAVQGSLRGF